MGGCVALLETGLRREARGLLPPSCAPLSRSWRHTPASAVTGPTNRDAPQGAHEKLPELSSKMSSPRDTSTNDYNTLIQQCMSEAKTNKPITAYVVLELSRQSALTPTYQCGLVGLPQHSPQRPSPHNRRSSAASAGPDQCKVGLHTTPLFGGRQGRATDKTPC